MAINTLSAYSPLPPALNTPGFFIYQLPDQENNFFSGTAGSYLGKNVFNIVGGFNYQKNAMFHYETVTAIDLTTQVTKRFALDFFYDAPVNKEKDGLFGNQATLQTFLDMQNTGA